MEHPLGQEVMTGIWSASHMAQRHLKGSVLSASGGLCIVELDFIGSEIIAGFLFV